MVSVVAWNEISASWKINHEVEEKEIVQNDFHIDEFWIKQILFVVNVFELFFGWVFVFFFGSRIFKSPKLCWSLPIHSSQRCSVHWLYLAAPVGLVAAA